MAGVSLGAGGGGGKGGCEGGDFTNAIWKGNGYDSMHDEKDDGGADFDDMSNQRICGGGEVK